MDGAVPTRLWRRQTQSKNAILIDGRGQYADADKARSKAAQGRLIQARQVGDVIVISGDATAAYRTLTPAALSVVRDLHLIGDRYLVVVDRVELAEPLPIQWRLHAAHPIVAGAETFRLTGERAGLYGQFVLATAGPPRLRVVHGYPGVPAEETQGLELHWHVEAQLPPARRHVLVTLLVPYPKDARRRVLHYIDDQGYDVHAHFVEADGHEHTITIEKVL